MGPVASKAKQQAFLSTKNRKTISLTGENITHVDDSEEKLCDLCPSMSEHLEERNLFILCRTR